MPPGHRAGFSSLPGAPPLSWSTSLPASEGQQEEAGRCWPGRSSVSSTDAGLSPSQQRDQDTSHDWPGSFPLATQDQRPDPPFREEGHSQGQGTPQSCVIPTGCRREWAAFLLYPLCPQGHSFLAPCQCCGRHSCPHLLTLRHVAARLPRGRADSPIPCCWPWP